MALTKLNFGGNQQALVASDIPTLTTNKMPTGSVLQVVSAENNTGFTTTSTSFQSTSVTASITPSSTSSKILIVCQVNLRIDTGSADGAHMEAQIQRGGSAIGKTIDHGTREIAGTNNVDNMATGAILTTLDSPSTTSSTTYTVFIRALSTGVTAKINQGNSGSVITLMEIAG